jgi:hypothetical protein
LAQWLLARAAPVRAAVRAAGAVMKLDQEVRHKSEDIADDVLLDVVKAIRRRVRIVDRA